MSAKTTPTISIAELKAELSQYPGHYRISFGGLSFYRIKQRDDEMVQMEFNPHIYLSESGSVEVENP